MTIDNQFIQHYEPMLRKLARQYASHLKQCPALEERDLVQEAWLALMERPDMPKTTRKGQTVSLRALLCSFSDEDVLKTASNAMQAAIRRYANINVPLQEQHAIELFEDNHDPWNDVQRAADSLSPHEKQLMDMLLKRIPRQEMATRMNIPHATLRQQIKRLRHKLRKACPTIIR